VTTATQEIVLAELESYARSHEALKAGRGKVDDVLGFVDWFRSAYKAPPRIPDADWPSPGYLTPEPDPTGPEYRTGE
jgi:hypothetical protein